MGVQGRHRNDCGLRCECGDKASFYGTPLAFPEATHALHGFLPGNLVTERQQQADDHFIGIHAITVVVPLTTSFPSSTSSASLTIRLADP
jgi:hypothetical protein